MKCLARQHSDQMICDACGLVWDTNDTDPPKCRNGDLKRHLNPEDFSPSSEQRERAMLAAERLTRNSDTVRNVLVSLLDASGLAITPACDIYKTCNLPANLGKTPLLVLVEQMKKFIL